MKARSMIRAISVVRLGRKISDLRIPIAVALLLLTIFSAGMIVHYSTENVCAWGGPIQADAVCASIGATNAY